MVVWSLTEVLVDVNRLTKHCVAECPCMLMSDTFFVLYTYLYPIAMAVYSLLVGNIYPMQEGYYQMLPRKEVVVFNIIATQL